MGIPICLDVGETNVFDAVMAELKDEPLAVQVKVLALVLVELNLRLAVDTLARQIA